MRRGRLDDLLRPLGDPEIPAPRRAAIESVLEQELVDPSQLADCRALPEGHPLRMDAARIADALAEASSRPCSPDELGLVAISRRSPLAPWKMLVMALAAFHRGDDQACRRSLDAIRPGSSPARLVPVLRAMIDGRPVDSLGKAARKLAAGIYGDRQALRREVESLDRAFEEEEDGAYVLRLIRTALARCAETCPDLLERLRQHISIRAVTHGMDVGEVRRALGGASRKDAYFWRLFARAMEDDGRFFQACSLWEEYRCHALHEGLFPAEDPGLAALYLHMADLLCRCPPGEFEPSRRFFARHFDGYDEYYTNQPAAIRAAVAKRKATSNPYFLDPDRLYRRAAALDPDPDVFRTWLSWARRSGKREDADRVASAWHAALPEDSQPLLLLMESAERRKAFKKALRFLEAAERIDGLNPELRRARSRLLVSMARRHLKQGRVDLASRDIEILDELPGMLDGDRPAFSDCLRWVGELVAGAGDDRLRALALDLCRRMGSQLAVDVMLVGVSEACGLPESRLAGLLSGPALLAPGELAGAVSRVVILCDELGLPIRIADRFRRLLSDELSSGGARLDSQRIRALAEAALRSGQVRLAYTASGAGLRLGDDEAPRFLLLRARSLPAMVPRRKARCLEAAAWRARRQRRLDILEEAVELRRGRVSRRGRWPYWADLDSEIDRDMTRDDVDDVIRREREDVRYPRKPEIEDDFPICNCPACRRRRGELRADEDECFEPDLFGSRERDIEVLDGLDSLLPPDIQVDLGLSLLQLIFQHMGPDGFPPNVLELIERDPELAVQFAALKGVRQTEVDLFGGPPLPGTPRLRRGQKKRKKKRRKGRRR
ncbi:MAG: hypothetical protein JXR96_16890 [Deltaproteobacteria bacterium]|nr:hypothetical protein [Deltaproteobacteria bacterium]